MIIPILTKCCQSTGERDIVKIAVDETNLVRGEGKSRKVRRSEAGLVGGVTPGETPLEIIVDVATQAVH